MEVVKFKTDEERREAVRRMIGLRKVFEARIREINATKNDLQVAL